MLKKNEMRFKREIEENDDLKMVYDYPKDAREKEMQYYMMADPPYVIIYKANLGDKWIVSEWGEIKLRKTAEDYAMVKHYDPFVINWVEVIQKLDAENEASILEFCNQYGLLLNNMGNAMVLEEFKDEIKRYKRNLEYYWDYINDINRVIDENLLEQNRLYILTKAEPPSYTELIKVHLVSEINHYLRNFQPEFIITNESSFRLVNKAGDLISVLYYHLAMTLQCERELKRCILCKNLFEPRQKSQKFCPSGSDDYRKRSNCENNYNGTVKRFRKAFSQGKLTIEEAAKRYGRSIEEVEEWTNSRRRIK